MMRVVLFSRSGQWGSAAAAGMWVVTVGIGRAALKIDLSSTFPPTKIVLVELCAIVSATLLAIVTRPRYWEWDRVARGARARVLAGVVAACVIGLAALCVLVVVPWLPADATWGGCDRQRVCSCRVCGVVDAFYQRALRRWHHPCALVRGRDHRQPRSRGVVAARLLSRAGAFLGTDHRAHRCRCRGTRPDLWHVRVGASAVRALDDLVAVHLAHRIGDQFGAGAVRVLEVDRDLAVDHMVDVRLRQAGHQFVPAHQVHRDRHVVQAVSPFGAVNASVMRL